MIGKKTKKLVASLLLGVCVFVGLAKWDKPTTNETYQKQIQIQETKVDYSNLVIEGLEKINNLEVLQLNVNYDMTIHGTIFKNNFFRNDKIVTLNTTARYKIDLDDVMSNVIFSGDNITVLVHINTEVFVNEDSIIYRDDKGYLAFGDVTITPEEYNSMVVQAKENISSEMMKKENYDVAKENVEKRVKEIITTVGHDTYNINIKWI